MQWRQLLHYSVVVYNVFMNSVFSKKQKPNNRGFYLLCLDKTFMGTKPTALTRSVHRY